MPKTSDPITKETRADGSVRYRVTVDTGRDPATGRRVQRKARFTTYREARAWLAATRTEVTTGRYVPPSKVVLAEHLARWLDGRTDVKPGTLANYRDAVKIVTATLGQRPLAVLSKADVDGMVRGMLNGSLRRQGRAGEPLSPATVRLTLTVLTMALDAAVKEGKLARNVAALVDRPRQQRREKVVWEAAEAAAFTTVSDEDRLAGAWRLSLSGLRRGEVLGLRWGDVELDAGAAHVRRSRVYAGTDVIEQDSAKSTAGERTVPLTADAVTALRRTRARQAEERLAAGEVYQECGLVAVDEIGRPVAPRWYGDRFKALSRAAGVPVVTLHTARHGYGSHLLDQGVPLPIVSKVMGHSSVHVTAQVYAHVIREGADERVRAAMVAAGF